MKKKALLIGVVAVGLLGWFASTANAKDKKTQPVSPPTPEDDIETKDNETIVIPPGPEGIPDGSSIPVIVREEDEPGITTPLPSEQPGTTKPTDVLPIIPTQEEVEEVAADLGESPKTVVDELVKEVVPEKPAPIAVAETSEDADPHGTITLARLMLTRENLPGWKEDLQPAIKAWQEDVGLKPDGKFGVKSVTRMAEEVGILPLVRFWSVGTHYNKNTARNDYLAKIRGVIDALKSDLPESAAHIAALEQSMAREQAQSLVNVPPPVKTEQWVANAIKAATDSAMKEYLP